MRLCVVIPHHSRTDLLPQAIRSAGALPVMVVDDSGLGLTLPEDPQVRVVMTPGDQGFAHAANAGLTQAQAAGFTHVILLNDDAALEPGCVDALQRAWGPGSGAVGPVLVDQTGRIESAGIAVRSWGRVRVRSTPPAALSPVDALSGACLLIDAQTRFDTAYTHGMEDIELCLRLRQAGRSVTVEPAARCRHVGGATLDRRSREAQGHAVAGHLRLMGGGLRSPVVLGLAIAQVITEGGPADRLAGVVDGWRAWRRAQGMPPAAQVPDQGR